MQVWPDSTIEDMAWNVLMQPPAVDEGLRDQLGSIGCPHDGCDMNPNSGHQVWADPDASDDGDMVPAIVGDSSDDELWHDGEAATTFAAEPGFDTDEELGYDDWYDARRGSCRGDRENVLGSERPSDPVA